MGFDTYRENIILTKEQYKQWGKTGIIIQNKYYDLRESEFLDLLSKILTYDDDIDGEKKIIKEMQSGGFNEKQGTELINIFTDDDVFASDYDIYSNEQALKNYVDNKEFGGDYEVLPVENSFVIMIEYIW